MRINLPDLSQAMPTREGFCHPDWELIGQCIESVIPEKHWYEAWCSAARQWMDRLCETLGGSYHYYETKNFMIMTEASTRVAKDACKFYEKSLKLILKHLPGVTRDDGFGKQVVLMFSSQDDYYGYIMYFYEDGEHPMSGGVCLNGDGYVHYAFPLDDENPSGYRETLVHELTHGCLRHLPIPLWLNEAIAMRMENAICFNRPIEIDKYVLKQHHDHWNADTIQEFWSGESWNQVGDSFELSYSLAQIIWRKIEVDLRAPQSMIIDFILSARYEDAGESASQRVFELSMGDFVEDFLGEGNWSPVLSEESFPEPIPQDPI